MISFLGIFDIVCFFILLLMFIGSQFGFMGGGPLSLFYIISGIGILKRKKKVRTIFLKWSIPLSFLAALSFLVLTGPEVTSYFRMTLAEIIQYSIIYITFPLIVNFIILTRSRVKEQFK